MNVAQWIGSTAPTVGQKAMAESIPVVLPNDMLDLSVAIRSWLGDSTPTVGQKPMAMSIPVVIASDQGALPLSPNAATEGTLSTIEGFSSQMVGQLETLLTRTPPLGQGIADGSVPVVIASDQSTINQNLASWIGSTAPTVGQKPVVDCIPVVLASDHNAIEVTGSLTAAPQQPTAASSYAPVRASSGVILPAATTLFSIYAHNGTGSAVYLLTFDAAAVPSDGAIPVDFFMIPANSIANFDIPRSYATGVCWAASSTVDTLTIVAGPPAPLLVRARYS